jgi:osmotically-inducible protein OsmY
VQDEYEDLHRRHERRQRQMSGEGRGGYSAGGGGWGQGGYGRDPDERWPDEDRRQGSWDDRRPGATGYDRGNYGQGFGYGGASGRERDEGPDQDRARGRRDQERFRESERAGDYTGGHGQGFGRGGDDQGYQGRGYGGEYERDREERAGYGQFGGRRGSGSTTYAPSWQTPGEYSGRGPKGYKRSDERVRDDVSDRLEQSGSIDASEIEIEVEDGVVTLRGSVSERTQKRLAEEATESTPGVRDVRNEIRVAERDARDGRQAAGTQQGRMGSEPQAGELPSATAARSQTGSQRPATRGGQASEGQATQSAKGSRESQPRG